MQQQTQPYKERASILSGPGYCRAIKPALDMSLALLLLLVFGLPMALIALAIKLHSRGPVLYRQQRIGKDGVPFTMLKFRSMRVDSDPQIHRNYVRRLISENSGPQDLGTTSLKMQRDPRISGLGRLLRATCLDELPQVFNVLRRDMSLVGPRPPLSYEYELYQEWHKQRQQVLPGITGLWQVTARNLVPFDEMVRIDLRYIRSASLWLDLKIILRTPFAMLRGKGGG